MLTSLKSADIGSVTILWSQPIGGLQILSLDGVWRWVRHMDNALVCLSLAGQFSLLILFLQVINAGDVLTFLCGGFYPATRHRVIPRITSRRDAYLFNE
jgi:isopenicillin N synthase-like dioxygenase